MNAIITISCLVLSATLLFYPVRAARPVESYSESLLLRRLDETSIGLRFEFVIRKDLGDNNLDEGPRQYEFFPKLVAQVVTKNVSDVRLVLTRGTWRWGSETMWPSVETGAPGVELWAKVQDPDRDWQRLVRGLSGMTCASLDTVQKSSNYVRLENGVILASLPSETVCVENLAPWQKLLPCRGAAGLGELISPKAVVRSQYYSVAVVVRRTAKGIELIQSLSAVLPIKDSLLGTLDRANGKLLNRSHCGGQSASQIVVDSLSRSTTRTNLFPKPEYTIASEGRSLGTWNLTSLDEDIRGLTMLPVFKSGHSIRTKRWLSGHGDIKGTISTALYNDDPSADLHVKHLEILPSFIRPRLGTLKVLVGSLAMDEETLRKQVRITSTRLRGPPATLEFRLVLPRNGTRVLITVGFTKAFLSFDEFPPDPNRGMDVPSSLTFFNRSCVYDDADKARGLPAIWRRSHLGPIAKASEALLITLPHPDFSMPYNVITLSSTGFALFLGMIVNVTVRRRGDRWAPKRRGWKDRLKAKCARRPQATKLKDH